MGSNLFFPDNHKRYDRMNQLLNDVSSAKALALGQIDSQKNTTARLDKTCKDLMAKAGFKTIDELHESVMKTLPDDQRDRYIKSIKLMKEFDDILGNANVIIGIVGSVSAAISIPIDRKLRMIEMAHDVEQKAAWNRGFSKFWRGSPIEGWSEMTRARKLMGQHMKEALIIAGEDASKAMRFARTLRVIGEIMETIAKWAFILEIVVLWIQFNVEADQRREMQKAIKVFFYYRFAVVEQLMNIMATGSLYVSLDAYLLTKDSMIDSGLDETIMNTVLTKMANKMVDDHRPDLDKITDANVWAQVDDYDSRHESMEKVYTADDPAKDQARNWLAEQAKEREEEEKKKKAEEEGKRIKEALEKAKSDNAKHNLKLELR